MPRLLPALLVLSVLPAAAQTPPPGRTPTVFEDPALVQRYQATITPEELAGHLYVYASDHFEGRETGTPGQHLAALWLAGQYQAMGLAPKGTAEAAGPGDPRAFLQPFDLQREALVRSELVVRRGGQEVARSVLRRGEVDGESLLLYGAPTEATAPVVFGGYGAQGEGYDDYEALRAAGVETAGKWLVLLAGQPPALAGASAEGGGTGKIVAAFQQAQPRGILIVDDEDPGSPSLEARARHAFDAVGNLTLPSAEGGGFQIPPIYAVSRAFADALLEPNGRTVTEITTAIAGGGAPVVFELEGTEVHAVVERAREPIGTENVLAFVEGSDPALRDEVVVISSHLDHIGVDPSHPEDPIHNGADDDGSGTVALLEMAEAFQQAKADGYGPRRSVLFLHVTGEEKGLLGSAYYADVAPVLPLENTVANLNIDMIGRADPTHPGAPDSNYVYVIGAELISTDIDEVNTRVNEVTGLRLDLSKRFNSPDDPNQFFARSDHWNFGKHQIPFIFYFSGTHEDYHGVDDEPEKVDYPRLAQRTRLVFGTAWQLASQDARPAVSGTGFN
jgi:hypothetical protein